MKNYLLDGLSVICEFSDSGEVLREYLPGVSVSVGGFSYFYHYDRLASVRFLTDESGNIVQEYSYDVWGNLVSSSGSISQPYQYVGKEGYYREGDLDLYLLGQRWYDEEVGRFISRDPIGEEGGLNLYVYVGNNPVNLKDSTGLTNLIERICKLCNLLPGRLGTICEWLCPPPSLNPYEACHLQLSEKRNKNLICWYRCESGKIEILQIPDPCGREKCSTRVFRYLDTGTIDDPKRRGPYIGRPFHES